MASCSPPSGDTVDESGAHQTSGKVPVDLPTAALPQPVDILPALPLVPCSPSNAIVLDGHKTDITAEGPKTKQSDVDRNSEDPPKSWHPRDSPKRKRKVRDGSVELTDSWIAPDVVSRQPKRMKVRDVEEWDTWIAPDLREEENTVKRRPKSRNKRKGRRSRRDVESFDSWVAETSHHHTDRDRDKDSDSDSDTEILGKRRSKRRRTRSPPRHSPPASGSNSVNGYQERKERDIPPHFSNGRDLPPHMHRDSGFISRLRDKDKDSTPTFSRGRDKPPHLSKEETPPRMPRERDTPPHIRRSYPE